MTSSFEQAKLSFEQKIPSRSDKVESLCLKIRDLLQENGLSQYCFPTELLARECLANALNHGNENDPGKSIVLQLQVRRAWIRLRVTDDGAGFSWRRAMKKEAGTGEVSGRGLRLYVLYGERFRFNRCGNRITIWIDKTKRLGNGD